MGSARVSEQKVVIITGGSFGIGFWLAEHLHKGGYKVAICGRREKEGKEKAATLDATGESVIFVQADVGSYQSQANLFQTVWKKWSRIDVLVANAGFIDQGSVYNFRNRNAGIDDLPPEPNLSVTEVNWKGTIYGTVLAIHFMRHNPTKGGKIIATGSTLGIYSTATFPEYCGTKAAINVFVRTIGPILKIKENIEINAVVSGPIETDAMPGFSTAFLPEQLVLKDNLISAYDRFLESDESGSTVEVAHDTLIDWGKPEFKSGVFAERSEKVYEPWFAWIHGEISELPDALAGPPERAQV